MIRLDRAGADSRLHSTLCAQCPHGATGCCASPPGVDWADIGRIVGRGGGGWLQEQMAAGNLRPGERGLLIRRVENGTHSSGVWPTKCVYHGEQGCTIEPDRRAATCNYFICDDAFSFGGEALGVVSAVTGREAHATLTTLFGRWDLEIQAGVRERWPAGPPWDGPFLEWVGQEYRRLVQRDRQELHELRG